MSENELPGRAPTNKDMVLRLFVKQLESEYQPELLLNECKKRGLLKAYKELQTQNIFNKLNDGQLSPNTPMLTIELIPRSCWFSNIRSNVSKQDWAALRKVMTKKVGSMWRTWL